MTKQRGEREPVRELWRGLSLLSTRRRKPRQRVYWTLLQLSGFGLLVVAAVTLGFGVGAGATGPTSGSTVSNAAEPQTPFSTGIPFSSGQNINVVIPANETFSADDGLNNNNSGINIVECAAPNGVVPTLPSACDGNTIVAGILPNTDGSFTYTGYTLYALPDSTSLGEGSSGPACGQTAATECISTSGTINLTSPSPTCGRPPSTSRRTPPTVELLRATALRHLWRRRRLPACRPRSLRQRRRRRTAPIYQL